MPPQRVYQVVASFNSQQPVLISATVVKETAVYFFIERTIGEPDSWHWSSRIEKAHAHTTVAEAWTYFKGHTQREIHELKIKLDVRRARIVHADRALARLEPACEADAPAETLSEA